MFPLINPLRREQHLVIRSFQSSKQLFIILSFRYSLQTDQYIFLYGFYYFHGVVFSIEEIVKIHTEPYLVNKMLAERHDYFRHSSGRFEN